IDFSPLAGFSDLSIYTKNVLHNRQILVKTPENYSFANSTEEEIALNSETMIQKRQAVPRP
ncbi:hypothetical protein, partial [Gemmiger formicilis]|uniref:hypothetical protein n=1 Tax=Gemmiger formicilis TaxID=745368 RepID=UPI00195C7613